MDKAIFNTKFVQNEKRNGEKVKVIDYVGNDMYLIKFKDGKELKVYGNELIFIGNKSIYD